MLLSYVLMYNQRLKKLSTYIHRKIADNFMYHIFSDTYIVNK